MRQYLRAALKLNEVISVPQQDEEGKTLVKYMQVVSMQQRVIRVETYECEVQGVFVISVQPFEEWAPSGSDGQASDTAEVFIAQDPYTVDILAICAGGRDLRDKWRKWCVSDSDVEGCQHLHGPSVLQPTLALGSSAVPVLSLMDCLQERGYDLVPRTVEHISGGPLVADSRKAVSRRSYFQCVIALPELLKAGVRSFSSGLSNAFYTVLLQKKMLPPLGLPAAKYQEMLALDDGDEIALKALTSQVGQPAKKRRVEALLDDPDVVGDEGFPAIADNIVQAAVAQAAAEAVVVGNDDAGAEDRYPEQISGCLVSFVKGRQEVGHTYHARLKVVCPVHPACSKSRSLNLLQEVFGARAAEGFLGAWIAKAESMSEADHKGHMPRRDDIHAWLAQH